MKGCFRGQLMMKLLFYISDVHVIVIHSFLTVPIFSSHFAFQITVYDESADIVFFCLWKKEPSLMTPQHDACRNSRKKELDAAPASYCAGVLFPVC